jgi:hypothetical protein
VQLQTLDDQTDAPCGASIEDAVSAYLHDRFSHLDCAMSRANRWLQQRIVVASLEKVKLILEADDPVEECYANLVREIDAEAAHGIFLASPAGNAAQLDRLAGKSAISGRLFQYLPDIAPFLFADELAQCHHELAAVWAIIEARYDRANLDTEVSELMLMHLIGDEESAAEASDELRRIFYASHEDEVRRRCNLPNLVNDQTRSSLMTTVSGLRDKTCRQSDRAS